MNKPSPNQVVGPIKYQDYSPRETGVHWWGNRFLLFVEGVTAVFDGFTALDLPAFGIEHGELRVIIGPNGAGKTTFCDLVSGKTRLSTGEIFFDGRSITGLKETEIARRGIGRKFQTPTVFDSLTTFENMELALPGQKQCLRDLMHSTGGEEIAHIDSILQRVHLIEKRNIQAKYLSHGQRQWLAISMLILMEPKLLMIDEPAAGLTDSETALTAELLLELKEKHTMVVIEHDMDFVRQLDSKVSVLCEGKLMAEGSIEEVQQNQQVIEAYLGR
ncbi:MAG: urea ABC transporter ATP-binding protein UrtD [Verrucomicrobiota bacterium]|nr:urea ABC transporter ATP-binding protein UrtD [Verrucomicrobiota bacterium]